MQPEAGFPTRRSAPAKLLLEILSAAPDSRVLDTCSDNAARVKKLQRKKK
jgi:hypothetical protein